MSFILETHLNEWVDLVEVQTPDSNPYYYIKVPDYVFILAITETREVPIVFQYRYAQERYTRELPAGLVEEGISPLDTAIQELREEVGVSFWSKIIQGPTFVSDSGRIRNHSHLFVFMDVVKPNQQIGELDNTWVSSDDLVSWTLEGKIDHIGQSTLVLWALHQGYL